MPLVATILPPREGFGPGSAGAIGMIARRLARTPDFQTVVFGGRQDGPIFPDIDFRPVAPSPWRIGSTNLRYAAAVADAVRRLKPALLEVHNRPEMALAIAERVPSIPIVGFLHNDPIGMRGATSTAERTHLLKTLTCVAMPSAFLRDRLLDGLVDPPKRPAIVPNCLDLSEFPPPAAKERRILFVGRVVADKAPDVFVSAFAAAAPHVPGWTAEIIGADRFSQDSPETPYVRSVKAAAEAAGVRILGFRRHRDVLEAMNRAAIVVMPSRWDEPFGLVALEAMASRTALICSPRGALQEVAGDAALFIDPDDIAGVAAAIRTLCGDEARRQTLAEAGHRRAAQFDLGPVTARLAELRMRLIAGDRLTM
ncbi:MAG TPA: glycosyltransferase family 4 protein [Rhodopila sp.]|uniref:glycosyltransferase family 4 protein n=1 Tax=Rhodopila sp. TaxID=2480087 RepID=UPI002CC594F2|nr:glycosyltransferase family 4 protein [Rhodopila sp.]HVY18001.1 glycosyltransferase family 4 protein [Rhodopila sp.]